MKVFTDIKTSISNFIEGPLTPLKTPEMKKMDAIIQNPNSPFQARITVAKELQDIYEKRSCKHILLSLASLSLASSIIESPSLLEKTVAVAASLLLINSVNDLMKSKNLREVSEKLTSRNDTLIIEENNHQPERIRVQSRIERLNQALQDELYKPTLSCSARYKKLTPLSQPFPKRTA